MICVNVGFVFDHENATLPFFFLNALKNLLFLTTQNAADHSRKHEDKRSDLPILLP